jgi:hypothetical protein
MAAIHVTLRRLLEQPKFRKSLLNAFHIGSESSDKFHQIDLADHIRHARGGRTTDTPFDAVSETIADVIQSAILDKLPKPHAITLEELTSIAIAQLAGVPVEDRSQSDYGHAWQRFVAFVLAEIDLERIDGRLLGIGDFSFRRYDKRHDEARNLFEPGSGPHVDVLWTSPSGFMLSSVVQHFFEDELTAYGQLSGYCSELALQRAVFELEAIVKSVGTTAQLRVTREDLDFEADGLDPVAFAPVSYLVQHDGLRIVRTCLDAYTGIGIKGDVLNQLALATERLAEADQASHPASHFLKALRRSKHWCAGNMETRQQSFEAMSLRCSSQIALAEPGRLTWLANTTPLEARWSMGVLCKYQRKQVKSFAALRQEW